MTEWKAPDHVRRIIESLKGLVFAPGDAEAIIAEIRLRTRDPQAMQQVEWDGLMQEASEPSTQRP